MTDNTSIHLFEFGYYQPLPDHIDLPAFRSYVKEVWENRHLFYEHTDISQPDSEDLQADLRKQGQALLQFDGRDIRARNFAGFIQFQGTTIHIHPKIFSATNVREPKIAEHLLFYLSYASPVRFPFSWQHTETLPQENFLQILIHFFATITEKILVEHPYHKYEEVSETAAFVRGKLDIPAYLRHSLSNGQWQEIYIRHSPFLYDNAFNQLVKYTAQLLISVATSRNLAVLHQILFLLNEVSNYAFTYEDCDKLAYTSLPQEHRQITALCRLFLAGQQIKSPQANDLNFSFMVPMERVFEDFTGNFLIAHFPEQKVYLQSTTSFARLNGHTAFRIRNDIWMPESCTVMDTKYKLLNLLPFSDQAGNGVLQNDLYQMLAYAIQRKAKLVHLIYPLTTDELQESFAYAIKNSFDGEIIQIYIHQIPVVVHERIHAADISVADRLTQLLKEKFQSILFA